MPMRGSMPLLHRRIFSVGGTPRETRGPPGTGTRMRKFVRLVTMEKFAIVSDAGAGGAPDDDAGR